MGYWVRRTRAESLTQIIVYVISKSREQERGGKNTTEDNSRSKKQRLKHKPRQNKINI